MTQLISSFYLVFLISATLNALPARGLSVEARFRRVAELCARSEYDPALKELDEIVRLDPKNPVAYSSRGTVWFIKKEYDKAIKDLDEAIRLEPDKSSSGHNIRGAAWYMKKDYKRGISDLDQAIGLNPNDREALNTRAWAAATCPDAKLRGPKMALDYAKRACTLDDWKNPYYLGTIAAAYAANGDFVSAVKWERKALEDISYQKTHGEEGRKMLKLFEEEKPYEEPEGAK